jgi:hypothetical protein
MFHSIERPLAGGLPMSIDSHKARIRRLDLGYLGLGVAGLAALSACSGASGQEGAAMGGDAGTPGSPAAMVDGGVDATPPPYPAFRPPMPQIQKGTLAVIASPVVVPVYFAGETLQAQIDAFTSSWLSSPVFAGSLGEYGVTSGRAGTSIALTESPSATLDATDVEAWLKGKLEAADPAFAPVDAATLASRIFVLYYPHSTSISNTGAKSCVSFGSYHAGVTLASGAVASYVVVPRCGASIDALTAAMTSAVDSAATNPIPTASNTSMGYWGFGQGYAGYDAFGPEVGTACEILADAKPAGLAAPIARVWSNAAAAAYHDPCVPAPGGPYFVAVPVAGNGATPGEAVIPAGQSVTIDLELLSDAPTGGPWTLKAGSLNGTSPFSYVLDHATGTNGDVRKLTITAPAGGARDILVITSTMDTGPARSVWKYAVSSR